MPTVTTQNFLTADLLNNSFFLASLKAGILLILFVYAIFSLIIVRQVDSMSKTLITGISPIVKGVAIVHAGFAIGLIFLAWGLL